MGDHSVLSGQLVLLVLTFASRHLFLSIKSLSNRILISRRLFTHRSYGPPPPTSLPLTERLQRLATTLQFGWFIGHATLLFAVFRYGMSYITFNYYSRRIGVDRDC